MNDYLHVAVIPPPTYHAKELLKSHLSEHFIRIRIRNQAFMRISKDRSPIKESRAHCAI